MKHTMQYKDDYSLSYAEYGDKHGYPILIQHGLIASISDFHLFDRLIEAGKHLICVARPGYGESSPYAMMNLAEWGDIVSLLVDHLNIAQFDVLGMSSGASYSYAIGRQFPEQARRIFIFSGIPALYDENVLSLWPYPVPKQASIAELERLAYEIFFSNISKAELVRDDIRDSMMNNCFGVAQDLILRGIDWGFALSDIRQPVYMQHGKDDQEVPFRTAEITANMLPNCRLDIRESGGHFSRELLDNFIKMVVIKHSKESESNQR